MIRFTIHAVSLSLVAWSVYTCTPWPACAAVALEVTFA